MKLIVHLYIVPRLMRNRYTSTSPNAFITCTRKNIKAYKKSIQLYCFDRTIDRITNLITATAETHRIFGSKSINSVLTRIYFFLPFFRSNRCFDWERWKRQKNSASKVIYLTGNILCGLHNILGEGYYQTTGNHRFRT